MMSEFLWSFRLRGTVLLSVWWKVAFVLLYTATVVFLHVNLGLQLNFPHTLIPIIGVVVGLLLAFRTNSAYDRYWEGRKLWSQMTQEVRKLTRCIWTGVHVQERDARAVIEKKSALNLCLAFVVATKHYLREEYSYDYADLKGLISHLPRFNTPSSNLSLDEQLDTPDQRKKRPRLLMAYDHSTPTNIPVELSYYIFSYIKHVSDKNLAPAFVTGTMHASLNNMVDCLTSFERILRTPIPVAYSVHLNHSVWLYILSLPYQIMGTSGWWTVPVVGLGSFCLLGILCIGWEIENPFGYDDNDLPLDDFCEVVSREMQMVIGSKQVAAEDWIYSEDNFPLSPQSELNALELNEKTHEDVLDILQQIAYDEVNKVFIGTAKLKDD